QANFILESRAGRRSVAVSKYCLSRGDFFGFRPVDYVSDAIQGGDSVSKKSGAVHTRRRHPCSAPLKSSHDSICWSGHFEGDDTSMVTKFKGAKPRKAGIAE